VIELMENAGLNVAVLARRMLGGSVTGRKVCCIAGKGNNGGDALVAARHLHNWGASVKVVLGGSKDEIRDVPARQLATVERMGIPIEGPRGRVDDSEILVDGLLGYGSKGNPRDLVAVLIRDSNSSGMPILAVDLPSGLDPTTGEPNEPCIIARATVTFGMLKTGFLNPKSHRFVGELYLADISMPRELYTGYSQGPSYFANDTMVRVR
jgi:NAD(P)H-hydrate epimerase